MSWPLIVHSLLSRFITDDLLRKEHYSVTTARIKHSEDEMVFAERIPDMGRRCREVFSSVKLVNSFKQLA